MAEALERVQAVLDSGVSIKLDHAWSLLSTVDIDTRYDIVAYCVALNFNAELTARTITEKVVAHIRQEIEDERAK